MQTATRRTILGGLATFPLVGTPAVMAATNPDAALLAAAADLETLRTRQTALRKAHRGMDADEIPGFAEGEDRYFVLVALIVETEAMTIGGIIAKARAVAICQQDGDWEATGDIGGSMAEDILRLSTARVPA